MGTNAIIMLGQKSSYNSPFAVFESFENWALLKRQKLLEDGMYFAVLIIGDKRKIDIHPNIFIQGYRPHSSGQKLSVLRREYGAFVPYGKNILAEDDMIFAQCQLYQVVSGLSVELILRNEECHSEKSIERMVARICAEQNFQTLGKIKRFIYHCPQSAGYFLGDRSYEVWSVVVGKNTGFSLDKKVLILDCDTGIPAIVDYNEQHFEKIHKSDT